MGGRKIHFLFRPALSFTITIDSALAGPSYEDKEINILEIFMILPFYFPRSAGSGPPPLKVISSAAIIMASHTARGTWFSQGF